MEGNRIVKINSDTTLINYNTLLGLTIGEDRVIDGGNDILYSGKSVLLNKDMLFRLMNENGSLRFIYKSKEFNDIDDVFEYLNLDTYVLIFKENTI